MAKNVGKSSMLGVGCLLQGLGLVSIVLGLLSIATIIGPIVLLPLGLWLLFAGSAKSSWRECSDCGTKLAGKKVKVCPGCKAALA